jgi:hypothetical protein
MKTVQLSILLLAAGVAAHADFSYTQTQKSSQSMPGAPGAAPQVTKQYFKGNKMLSDRGDRATLFDFSTQTVTMINKSAKTYSVQKIGDLMAATSAGVSPQIDVKQTGQKKTINGYNCSQAVFTVSMDAPSPAPAGMKMQVEMEIWISPDVPGAAAMHAAMRDFYKNNGGFAAMMGGRGNAGMQSAMGEMQKKISDMDGIPVLQVIRMKSAGAGAAAAAGAMNDPRMEQARAQLEAMKKQGGQAAAAAEQALARMGGGSTGGAPMFETTIESSDFSTASIPDSVFAIPAGFQQQ